MKLLRVGQKGSEKPAALDKEGKIRDISSHIGDLNPDHVNFETISKLQNVDLSSLPSLSNAAGFSLPFCPTLNNFIVFLFYLIKLKFHHQQKL